MIKPYKNWVLVEPQDEISEKEKKTGIHLPDHDNVMPDRGKIVAIGSDIQEVRVGETIVWDRIQADNYRDKTGLFEGKYMLIKEEIILAIIK